MSTFFKSCVVMAMTAAMAIGVVACAPTDPGSEALEGADETGISEDGLTGTVAVGTVLKSTTAVNLRKGASTNNSIIRVIPSGAKVTVEQANPQNGFYKVKHNGTIGWSYGQYYKVDPTQPDPIDTGDDPPSDVRTQALARAKSAMGFSYWWGHGRFRDAGVTSSTKGSCSGSCPNCSHSGQYGGDCSGLAAKVWQVPSSNTSLSDDEHPYSTADFVNNTSQWSKIDRGATKPADAMVYRSGGAGHIFIYGKGDGWGSMYAYECKGCSSGCVEGFRTASSAYKAIRKKGW